MGLFGPSRKELAKNFEDAEMNLENGNIDEAIRLYTTCAKHGIVEAQRKLGDIYKSEDGFIDSKKAIYWYKSAIQNGDLWAAYNLSQLYLDDDFAECSQEESVKWLKYAVDNGAHFIAGDLAFRYLCGVGVEQSDKMALHYATLGIYAGDPSSMTVISTLGSDGVDVSKQYQAAIKSLKADAESGDFSAQMNLAELYLEGDGTEKYIEKALYWFKKAAENEYGNPEEALYRIGIVYSSDYLGCYSVDEAISWFKKAIEHGNPEGYTAIGVIYANPSYECHSDEEAFKWFTKGAEEGSSTALVNLGDMYEKGEGVEQSREKALEYYEQAAKMGDPLAEEAIADLLDEAEDDE